MMDSYGNHPGVYECKKPNLTYFIVYRALEMINNMHVNGDVKVYAWMYWDLTEFGQTYTEAVKKMIQTKPLVAFKMSETRRVSLDCIQNMITKEFVEDVEIEDLFIEAEDKKEEKPKEKKTSTAKKIPHTKKLYDCSYAKVEKVLSTPAGSAKYQRIIENFLGRNINKLITKGPVHKLVFGSADQKQIFDLFGTSAKEINDIVEPFLKSVNPHTDWKLITNNPVYLLIASACFYYHAHKKKKELDSAIIEMGVAIYWSIMVKYWPYGANEGIMNYTIDKLSGKFLIKQSF